MKIKGKTLLVSVENEIKVGRHDAIEATVEHQIIAYDANDGSIGVDVDFIDITNIRFLGMPIDTGYEAYKRFKEQMLELGINVEELVEEATKELIKGKEIFEVKQNFVDLNLVFPKYFDNNK